MKYYPRNEEALRAEHDSLEKRANEWSNNNVNMLYLQPGTTMVRILPEYSQAGVFFHKFMKHSIFVGNIRETFACPAAMNLPCAVCSKGQELMNSRDEKKMEFARNNLRPTEKYLYNVLCYAAPPNNNGDVPEFGKVYVLEAGIMVHRQIIGLDQDPQTGWANVTNPESGVILIIKRTGKGQFDTKYTVNPHGGGRTNLLEECQTRGINLNNLQLIDLDQVPSSPPDWKLDELVNSIDNIVNNDFNVVPSPRPVLQTVSPAAAAAAPAAPASAPPAPGAAPQAPQWPQSPQTAPVGPQVPAPSVTAPTGQSVTPQVVYHYQPPYSTSAAPQVNFSTTAAPQPPVIPPPPGNDEEPPF